MTRLICSCVPICGIVAAVVGPTTAQCATDDEPAASLAKSYASRLMQAVDGAELHKFNDQILREASTGLLEQLMGHEDDTVALLARWLLVRNSIENRTDRRGKEPIDIDRGQLAGFLGFFEGRARVVPPAWWQERLLHLQCSDRYIMRVASAQPPSPGRAGEWKTSEQQRDERERYRWREDVALWLGPGIEDARRSGTAVVLRIGRGDVPLTKSLMEDVEERTANEAAAVNAVPVAEGQYLVALHLHTCGGFPLYLINSDKGDPVWCAEAWARGAVFGGTGTGLGHWVDFKIAHGNVYLFGAGWHSMYVECFRLADGKNLFRFGTSY